MKKKGAQTEKGAKLKQRIYNSALKLIIKKGFHRVSVDEICRNIGISKGNFYYYYSSKDQIMMDFFFQNDQIYVNEYQERISKMERAADKLLTLSQVIVDYIVREGIDILKNVYYIQIDPTKRNPFRTTDRPYYRITLDIIKEGQAKGEFRKDIQAEEIALLALMSIRGVSYEWCMRNGGFDHQAIAERMMKLFIQSISVETQPSHIKK